MAYIYVHNTKQKLKVRESIKKFRFLDEVRNKINISEDANKGRYYTTKFSEIFLLYFYYLFIFFWEYVQNVHAYGTKLSRKNLLQK